MQLSKELVGFFYDEATKNPIWAGTDTFDFMCVTIDNAADKGLINKYEKMEWDIMVTYGENLEDSISIIEELKKIAPEEFYARKNGNWDAAYNNVVRDIKEAQEESKDLKFPQWVLRLWDISLRAAKWTLEDALRDINL